MTPAIVCGTTLSWSSSCSHSHQGLLRRYTTMSTVDSTPPEVSNRTGAANTVPCSRGVMQQPVVKLLWTLVNVSKILSIVNACAYKWDFWCWLFLAVSVYGSGWRPSVCPCVCPVDWLSISINICRRHRVAAAASFIAIQGTSINTNLCILFPVQKQWR